MGKKSIIISVAVIVALSLLLVVWKDKMVENLKKRGFIGYTVEEAQALSYKKCSQCHNTEIIFKYCMRCGPPMAVVVHNMRKLIELEKQAGKTFDSYTDTEAIAIVQYWNGVIGNWEDAWRKEDLVKLLEGDKALIEFLDASEKDRTIEASLVGKSAPGVLLPMKPAEGDR